MTVQGSKVIDIANQDRGNGIQTGSLDSFQICFEHQLALLDLLAILHMNFEALAAQANSFQTHMDQNLSAVFSYQAACMAGFKHSIYGSIAGSIYLAVSRDNGNAFTQYTLGKSRIGNFCYRHGLTSHRSKNMIGIKGFFFLTKAGIWIGICGELGADISMLPTFLAMGIDELSVSPSAVLPVRAAIRQSIAQTCTLEMLEC